MIKINFNQIETIYNSLNSIIKKEIPIKTAYKLYKLIPQISNEYQIFTEEKNKLIEKYGEKDDKNNLIVDESNNSIKIKNDLITECTEKFNELFNIEIEIDFSPISIETFGDIDVSPKDLFVLKDFLID